MWQPRPWRRRRGCTVRPEEESHLWAPTVRSESAWTRPSTDQSAPDRRPPPRTLQARRPCAAAMRDWLHDSSEADALQPMSSTGLVPLSPPRAGSQDGPAHSADGSPLTPSNAEEELIRRHSGTLHLTSLLRSQSARLANTTAVLSKIPHSNCSKRVPNRLLRGRRGRFSTLLQQLECGILKRTAVYGAVAWDKKNNEQYKDEP